MLYGSVFMEKVPFPIALQNLAHAIPQGVHLDERTIQGLLLRLDRLLIDLTISPSSMDTSYAIRILSLVKTIVRQVGRQDVAKNQLICLVNSSQTSYVLENLMVYQPKDSVPSPVEAMGVLNDAYRKAILEGEEMHVSPIAWQSLKEHWERCRLPMPDAERTLMTAKRIAKEDNSYHAQLVGRLLKYIEELEKVWQVPLPPLPPAESEMVQNNKGKGESFLPRKQEGKPNQNTSTSSKSSFVLFDSHESKPS